MEKRNDFLISLADNQMDLHINNSCAGAAIKQKAILIAFDFNDNESIIQKFGCLPRHIQYLRENDLNSAIYVPIRSKSVALGVTGIFFKRRNGATAVDSELADYAVSEPV